MKAQREEEEVRPGSSTAPGSERRSQMDALANALRRKRRLEAQPRQESEVQTKKGAVEAAEEDESEEILRKKAKEALLREAVRSKERVKTMGPQGYLKPTCLQTNKRFLNATVRSTLFQAGERKRSQKKES
ncbi:hypothetical protein QR680_008452 [Steinernema hermaphroditum]|uniref:Uncharacterized protein n=1 Tax=Steinernema hermaphroditum TaxID=289476 RepID=A0AA39IJ16_9BILA|nr:hypothetical protein QR680_008452 [Steinernema hermaphroditum]